MTVYKYDKEKQAFVILPPARSFSINGLRLTNAKTSFAAGFGLHHWSILEGEFPLGQRGRSLIVHYALKKAVEL